MGYAPYAPDTLGLDWLIATEGITPLTTPTTCAAWLVDSTVTETISTIYVPHTWTGPKNGYGRLAVDVYNLADTGAGSALTTTSYQPNEDDAEFNVYAPTPTWGAVAVGSTYTKVDEVTPSDTDYLAFPNTAYARFAFNTSAFSGQPASVTFKIRAYGYYGTAGNLEVALYNNTTWVATLLSLRPPANGDDGHPNFVTYSTGPITTNPLTGVAWTAADIQSFDTASNLMLNLYAYSGNVAVSWVSMVVESGTDKRVATGSTAVQTALPSGTQTNLPVTLASNWAKANGTDYLIVARRLDDPTGLATTLIPQPIYLGTASCPHVNGMSYSTTLDPSGLLASTGSAVPSKTYGFWLGTSGGAMSADSQPYFDLKVRPCHATSTLLQGINAASAQAYKGCKLVVGYTATPTADLSLKVKRTSDNVQLGGTATITRAMVDAGTYLGSIVDADYSQGTIRMYVVDVDLASAGTLAAATNYYFELTSATTNSWWIMLVDATAAHALTGNQTYGGSTNQATVAGVGVAAADFLVRISSTPVTPSSITVTLTTASINGVSIDYAAISWVSGGALGVAFARWEVERSEDGGTTWASLATIETEATVAFADYEGKRATACKYRVRVVRVDDASSDWRTQTGTVTPAASTTAKAIFTTNSDPALTVGYTPNGTEMVFEDLSAAETVFVRLHDRDYQASFRPLEQRGIRWPFTAQVHLSPAAPSAGAGVRAFGALRAIATDPDAPYLCLHTQDGERFFGALQVGSFRRAFDGTGAYFAECVFTETQGDSSAVAL